MRRGRTLLAFVGVVCLLAVAISLVMSIVVRPPDFSADLREVQLQASVPGLISEVAFHASRSAATPAGSQDPDLGLATSQISELAAVEQALETATAGNRSVAEELPALYRGPRGLSARVASFLTTARIALAHSPLDRIAPQIAAATVAQLHDESLVALARQAAADLSTLERFRSHAMFVNYARLSAIVAAAVLSSVVALLALANGRRRERAVTEAAAAEFALIFDTSPSARLLIERLGSGQLRVARANAAMAELSGLAVAELETMAPSELVVGGEHEFGENASSFFDSGRSRISGIERTLLAATGEPRLVRIAASRLPDVEGISRAMVILEDVTESKRLLEAAESATRRMNAVVDGSGTPTVLIGSNDQIVRVNAAVTRLLGYRSEELVGQNCRVVIAPDAYHADWEARPGSGTDIDLYDDLLMAKDGRRILVRTSRACVGGDEMPLTVLQWTDITELDRLRLEAEAASRELDAIFLNCGSPILVRSLDNVVVRANDAACRFLGYRRDELVGMSAERFVAPGYFRDDLRDEGGRFRPDELISIDDRYLDSSGREHEVQATLKVVPGIDGAAAMVVQQWVDVTEARRLRLGSERLAARLNAVIDHCGSPMFLKGLDDRIIRVNHSACQLLGLTADQIVGRHTFEFSVGGFRADLMPDAYPYELGTPVEFDDQIAAGDGSVRLVRSTCAVVPDESGEPGFFVHIWTDVTRFAELQHKTEVARSQLSSILDFSGSPTVLKDFSGTITFANAAAYRLLGYPDGALVGMTGEQLVAPDAFRADLVAARRSYVIGEAEVFDDVLLAVDQRRIPVISYLSLVPSETDERGMFAQQWVDMSEIVAARREVESLLRRNDIIVQQSPTPIMLADANGQVLEVNQAFCTLTGYSRDQALAMSTSEFVDPSVWRGDLPGWRAEMGETSRIGFEDRILASDGRSIEVINSWAEVTGPDGGIEFVVKQFADVTEVNRYRRELDLAKLRSDTIIDRSRTPILVGQVSDGRLVRVNQAAAELIGYSVEQLLTMTFRDVIHPDWYRDDLDERALDAPPPAPFEDCIVDAAGHEHRVVTTWSAVAEADGSAGLIISQLLDVSELRAFQAALEASEAQTRAILSAVPDSMEIWGDDDRLVWAHYPDGRDPDTLHGRTYEQIYGPLAAEQFRVIRQQVQAAGQTIAREYDYVSDGGVAAYNVRVVPFGESILVSARDVTENHRDREDAARAGARLTAAFSAMPDNIFIVGRGGVIEHAHVAHGPRRGENFTGRSMADIFPDLGDRWDAQLDAMVAGATAVERIVEIPAIGDAEPSRLAEIRFVPIDNNSAIVVNRDVTDAVRMQRDLAERERLLRVINESAPVAIGLVDATGRMVSVNPRWTELSGQSASAARGHGYLRALHPSDRQRLVTRGGQALSTGQPYTGRLRLRHVDGTVRTVEVRSMPNRDDLGNVIGAVVTAIDLTAEIELEHENARLAEVLAASPDMVVISDPFDNVIYANQAARSFLRENEVFTSVLDASSERTYRFEVLAAVERYGSWSGELQYLLGNGTVPVSQLVVAERGPSGEVLSLAHMARDISELKQAEARLAHLATHDVLTGLPNRALFLDRVGQALSRRDRGAGRVGVIFIDLDGFKAVNDLLGHEAGDMVLTAAAARILNCVRTADTAARLGGDEFVVLCEDIVDVNDVRVIASRLVTALSEPLPSLGDDATIGCSIGIAFAEPAMTGDMVLAQADAAMYFAKKAGKGHYRFYDVELDQATGSSVAGNAPFTANP